MQIAPEIARDLLGNGAVGPVYEVEGERIGLHRVRRIWFNHASGHFVADVGACFMWSDGPKGPWRVVPNTAPCCRVKREAEDG